MSVDGRRAESVAVPEAAGRGEIPRRLPRHVDVPRQRGRAVLVVLVALTALSGPVGLYFLFDSAGYDDGAGLAILLALIPLPALWAAFWWLDRYEPEPRRYKLAAFVWGAVVAAGFALLANTAIAEYSDLTLEQMASFVAPVTEETAKGLFLLLTFLRWRRIIDSVLDGIIVAGIVGLGFAFVENILYYVDSYVGIPGAEVAGAEGATVTFVVRGIFSPFAHPLFTSALGIALGLAVLVRSRWLKVLFAVLGLAASMGLHFLWNASISYGGGPGFLLMYVSLASLAVALGVFAVIARIRQVRTLESSLSYVAERGWIHPAEIPYLSRFGYRKAARTYARRHHGRTAARVVRRYQRLASEVAFLHDALMKKRTKPHGVERTYAMLDAMYDLRPALRLPPALTPLQRPDEP